MDISLERTTHQNFCAAQFKGSKIEKTNEIYVSLKKKTENKPYQKKNNRTNQKNDNLCLCFGCFLSYLPCCLFQVFLLFSLGVLFFF